MPTATLKPVKRAAKGHNRFCGPAALSIIAGIDTAEASAVIRKGNGKRSVKGTSHFDLLRALSTLGYKASSAAKIDPLKRKTNPTIAAWLKSDERDGQSLYLISAGHHWQVVQGRRFCCGITKDIVSIRDPKVKRRARLVAVWKIEQDQKVNIADVLPPKVKDKVKVKDTEATVRRKARELAAKHEIEIETYLECDGLRILVWGQADVCDVEGRDPFWGDHYADDWADALERVQEYAKLSEPKAEAA